MANAETGLQKRIMLALSSMGRRVWRNNVGTARGKDNRLIRFGLAPGSSDLIGFVPVEIRQEHLGQTIAVFLAVEVKTARGRPTPEQIAFLECVRRGGGIAGVARSVEDAQALIHERFNGTQPSDH